MSFLKLIWPATTQKSPEARLGFHGEISDWLEQDLTVMEAMRRHDANWFDDEVVSYARHTLSHTMYGLALAKPPALRGQPYQGSYAAETFAQATDIFQNGYVMQGRVMGYEDFYDSVNAFAAQNLGIENFNRTLLWVLGNKTGKTAETLREQFKFSDEKLEEAAKQAGILFKYKGKVGSDKIASWEIYDGPHTFHYDPDNFDIKLPRGSNGIEKFVPYKIPTEMEIVKVYDRLEPMLHWYQTKVIAASKMPIEIRKTKTEDILGDMKVRELFTMTLDEKPRSYQPQPGND